MPRVLRIREQDEATPLVRLARAAGWESVLLAGAPAGSRYLAVGEASAAGLGPRRVQEIEALLRGSDASPLAAWIEAECLREEAEASRQRMQHLLQIAARMESAHALAKGLAHDFNNSLGILLGYTAFLREKLASQPELRQELDGIERAAGRAIDLTAKLSAFARQRGLAKKQKLSLDRLLAEFLPTMRQSLGEGIAPEIEILEPAPQIESAPEQIQEILSHLALNARDAMPEGGRFVLRLREIAAEEISAMGCAVSVSSGTRWALLEACDSGCGIPPHLLSRVFEPFFTTKEGKEGAGLGCAMIYSIARAHGGWAEVESPPGKGARFRVFLPAAR